MSSVDASSIAVRCTDANVIEHCSFKENKLYIYMTQNHILIFGEFFLRVGSCLKISSFIQCILLHINLF